MIYHLHEQISLKTRSSCTHYIIMANLFFNLPNVFIIPYSHLCFIILLFCISVLAFYVYFNSFFCEFYCLYIQLQLMRLIGEIGGATLEGAGSKH